MMGLSRDDFEDYCSAIDAALESCSTDKQRKRIAELANVMVNGESESARRAARSEIADIMCGLYSRSANLQASVVDEFCMKHFGVSPSAMNFSIPKSQVLEEIGYLGKRLAEDGDAGEFASRACSWASVKSQECANLKMEANCGKKYGKGKVKYAYVPRSNRVCGFCCMLASRGFDFSSPSKNELHKNCLCKLMPETAKPIEGYDEEVYKQGYELLYEGNDENGRPKFKKNYVFDTDYGYIVEEGSFVWDSSVPFADRWEKMLSMTEGIKKEGKGRVERVRKHFDSYPIESLDEAVERLIPNPLVIPASRTGRVRIVDYRNTNLEVQVDPRNRYFRIFERDCKGRMGRLIDGSLPSDCSKNKAMRLTHFQIRELQ